jgi:hypothetical protein
MLSKMKIKIVKLIFLIIACICAVRSAESQNIPNGLEVSATASLRGDTNAPQLFLIVHLLNTTNHDIVVLTKNLNFDGSDFEAAGVPDTNKKSWTLGWGNPAISYQGHVVVPSLYDFSPVTLRPNEEAIITQLEDNSELLKDITKDTQITITYTISSDWGSRFGTWNGSATSEPFKATLKKSR